MNYYFLEKEIPVRLAQIRRDMERSHRVAHLLTLRFRSRGAECDPSPVCASVVPAVKPQRA